jgi:hypothetical protein
VRAYVHEKDDLVHLGREPLVAARVEAGEPSGVAEDGHRLRERLLALVKDGQLPVRRLGLERGPVGAGHALVCELDVADRERDADRFGAAGHCEVAELEVSGVREAVAAAAADAAAAALALVADREIDERAEEEEQGGRRGREHRLHGVGVERHHGREELADGLVCRSGVGLRNRTASLPKSSIESCHGT